MCVLGSGLSSRSASVGCGRRSSPRSISDEKTSCPTRDENSSLASTGFKLFGALRSATTMTFGSRDSVCPHPVATKRTRINHEDHEGRIDHKGHKDHKALSFVIVVPFVVDPVFVVFVAFIRRPSWRSLSAPPAGRAPAAA